VSCVYQDGVRPLLGDLVRDIQHREAVGRGYREVDDLDRVIGKRISKRVPDKAGERHVARVGKPSGGGLTEHEDPKSISGFSPGK
jgi:hypothetical protein